jgi:hypothetical protein
MRGFRLVHEDGTPSRSILPSEFQQLVRDRVIDLPSISKDQIDDRSKADLVAKSFALLQTVWFITQCIARWAERLPVTLLELLTLSYTVLSFTNYVFWWNKPMAVTLAVDIVEKPVSDEIDEDYEDLLTNPLAGLPTLMHGESTASPPPITMSSALDNAFKSIQSLGLHLKASIDRGTRPTALSEFSMFYTADLHKSEKDIIGFTVVAVSCVFSAIHLMGLLSTFPSVPEFVLWIISSGYAPIFLLQFAYVCVDKLKTVVVPSIRLKSVTLSRLLTKLFPPTLALQNSSRSLWIVGIFLEAAAGLTRGLVPATAAPIRPVVVLEWAELLILEAELSPRTREKFLEVVNAFIRGYAIFPNSSPHGVQAEHFTLLLIFRGAPLVLALLALRALPSGALQTVQWTTFIPHV